MRIFFLLLFSTLFLSAALSAQSVTSLSGITQDPSGGIIPGVSISLTQIDTGAERVAVSDSQGRYVFSQV